MVFSLRQSPSGFSRAEVCAALCVFTLLAATLLTATARSREPGQVIGCANNLRQLGIAMLLYSSENDGMFPPRSGSPRWAARLLSYYQDLAILRCPSDPSHIISGLSGPDGAPRSYIANGWDDYFRFTLSPSEWS